MFLSQIPIIARFESCLLNPYSLDTALVAVCGVYLSDRIVAPDAVKAKASAHLSTALSPVLVPGFRCPQLSIACAGPLLPRSIFCHCSLSQTLRYMKPC